MTTKPGTIVRIAAIALILTGLAHATHAQFQGGRGGVNPRDPQATTPATAQPVSTEPPPLETDLVLLTVSVTPPEKTPRPPLTREHFQVFEEGVEQKIRYFWEDNRPISVGLLLLS